MFADGGAGELDEVAGAGDLDEREVAGAAADVADEDGLAVEELLLRGGEVVGDPGVEGGGGLFDERDVFEARLGGGLDGEFAGLLVKGSGDGEDDVLGGEGGFRMSGVPGFADVAEEGGGDFDGGEFAGFGLGFPGEDFGRAVDVGVGEPAFGRVDGAGGGEGALFAGVGADVGLVGEVEEAGEGTELFEAARGGELGDFEDADGSVVARGVPVGEGGVGGAEVDTDLHERRLNSSFQRCPPAATQ